MSNNDPQLVRENQRRDELNKAAKAGRSSSDPTERAKWAARDESSTRRFSSPDGGQ